MAEFKSILQTEAAWMNSHLSVARYAGGITVTGEGGKKHTLLIVNKEGKDLTQTGIPPGEPADLVDKEFIPLYKKLGRDKFIEVVNAHSRLSRKDLKIILTEEANIKAEQDKARKEEERKKLEAQSPTLDFQ